MAQLSQATEPVRSVSDVVRESFLTGVAVVVPLLVTTVVFAFLFNTLYRYLAFVAALVSVSNRVVVERSHYGERDETDGRPAEQAGRASETETNTETETGTEARR